MAAWLRAAAEARPCRRSHDSKNRILLALGRLKTGQRNKTEASYEALLTARHHAGEVAWFRFEGLKLRLADNTFYTPDFAVMLADGQIECHEVKGGYRLQSYQRARLAFDQARVEFPWLAWTWATRSDGGWKMGG